MNKDRILSGTIGYKLIDLTTPLNLKNFKKLVMKCKTLWKWKCSVILIKKVYFIIKIKYLIINDILVYILYVIFFYWKGGLYEIYK